MSCKDNKVISAILVLRGMCLLISFFAFGGFVLTYVRDSLILGKGGYSLIPIGVSLIVFIVILLLPKLFGCPLFEDSKTNEANSNQ